MNIFFITIIFIVVQICLKVGKIVLEQLVIESETAYYLEACSSSLLSVAYYFVLLQKEISPIVCYFSAISFGIFCFICSWGVPKLTDFFFAWGDEDIHLETSFPLLNAFVLLLAFIPSGFGTTIGIADLFDGKIKIFIILLTVQLCITALTLFILNYFEDHKFVLVTDVFLNQMTPFLIWNIISSDDVARGHIAILAFVLLFIINVETIIIFYFAEHQLDISCFNENFWKIRGYIFLGQILVTLSLYIFPLISKVISFVDSLIS